MVSGRTRYDQASQVLNWVPVLVFSRILPTWAHLHEASPVLVWCEPRHNTLPSVEKTKFNKGEPHAGG